MWDTIKQHGGMAKRSRAQIEADKYRTGRPALPKTKTRSEAVRVRFTRAELVQLKRRVKAAGLSVAGYIRKRIMED